MHCVLVVVAAVGVGLTPAERTALIAEGERLFFSETFGGNGRTCGTCHPRENNFTIDPAFIATLPTDDPLFVSEQVPELTHLEDPVMLRQGLILENIDGFIDHPPVFRSVQHLLGVKHTLLAVQRGNLKYDYPRQHTGWSGDGAPVHGRLHDFLEGAIRQHLTRSLWRRPGIDFRFPTAVEKKAVKFFLLSLGRPRELDVDSMRFREEKVELGRQIFMGRDTERGTKKAGKCTLCHSQAGANSELGDFSRLFDTGVVANQEGKFPADGGFGTEIVPGYTSVGFGDGRFNVPSLVEAADTGPWFHDNSATTLEQAVQFYDSDGFKKSPAAIMLRALDSGGILIKGLETGPLAAFLRAINALENIRSANVHMYYGRLALAELDINDAIRVLEESDINRRAVIYLEAARLCNDRRLLSRARAEILAD